MQSLSSQLSKRMVSLLSRNGITTPTPVQEKIIPAIFDNRDVLAQSETGSGKTLSFAIPLIELMERSDGPAVLVVVPTRELCVQVAGEFMKFSEGKHLGITPVYGGVSISQQVKKMHSTNIIVATPGRLIDLLNRRALSLEAVRFLVLDEADRMLDMGFIGDIEKILKHIPAEHQTLLFSATVSKEIEQLSRKYLRNPVHVKFESEVKPEFLQQTYYQVSQEQKLPLLIELLKKERELTLVFCNRKHFASKLARRLSQNGIHSRSLHGDLSQSQRERVTNEFRKRQINVLVATDIAARGLHIEGISHVYNYEIPKDVESYTHRIGRTARAGQKGEAISFVGTPDEQKFFKNILFSHEGRIRLQRVDNLTLSVPVVEQRSGEKPAGSRKPYREADKKKRKGWSNTFRKHSR
jgi:ATP-dependent RNA helicase DeaD